MKSYLAKTEAGDGSGDAIFIVRVSSLDMMRLKMKSFDAAFLEDCARSSRISDALLGLQHLFLRMEQQLEQVKAMPSATQH